MFNRRLVLWALCLATAASVPSRAAQSTDPPYSPVPASAMLAALDLAQNTPDPACVADYAAAHDRSIAYAEALMKARGFYSTFSTNCKEYGDRKCTAVRNSCQALCGPKPDGACLAACNTTFQNCCYTGAVAFEESWFSASVAKCPMVKVPPPPPPKQPSGLNVLDGAPKSAEAALNGTMRPWGKETLVAWEAYQATRPAADRAADDKRRLEAFNEVRADLTRTHGTFSVVSGGGGRLWIVRPSGEPLLMEIDDAAYFRRGAQQTSLETDQALARRLRLSLDELHQLALTAQTWHDFGNDFKSGQALNFHPGESGGRGMPVLKASVEHFSIKGTINGGGDFI